MSTRHELLQELFLEAVELPAERREDFLAQACGDDVDLRRALEELIAADSTTGQDEAPGLSAHEVSDLEGSGRYRILGEIGRGGMGVVYLAERADGAFRRQVAIKVLRAHVGREAAARFKAERHILAALDHPNIARVLDGGTLPTGAPFLVMEHVDGETIDRHVETHQLDSRARISLVLQVCDAVQAAHQNLVVHRDLKPGNVLVTRDGVPKLLDFGIAKLLDPSALDWTTAAETRTANQPLTPRYASPEQVLGRSITTATDVYALGLLLYQLLTGQLPYRPRSAAPHHWIEAICEQDPTLPSAAITTGSPLPRDLDHIILMALRKEPGARYPTAAELAADLRRHLDGHPVHARRPTLSYRAGKFLRRHRWAAAVAAAAIAASSAFTLGLQRELRRTQLERDKARTVTDLLVGIFELSGPSTVEGREPSAREILDRGFERVAAGLEGQPEVEAELFSTIGRVYNNLGTLERAAEAHQRALELRRLHDPESLDYAESLGNYAVVMLSLFRLEEAEAAYREALELTVGEVGESHPHALSLLDGLAQTLTRAGRHREAAGLAQQVVDATLARLGLRSLDAALSHDPSDPGLVPLATALGNLGASQRQIGRYRDAEATLGRALELNRRLFGREHFTIALGLNNLANVQSNGEARALAVATRAEAITLAEAALGDDHPSTNTIRLNQGYDLIRLGRAGDGMALIDRARANLLATLGPDHPALTLADSYEAIALAEGGAHHQALELHDRAIGHLEVSLGADHPETAKARSARADTLVRLRRYDEAIEAYQQAAGSLSRAGGEDHPETLECRSRGAEALLLAGRPDEARMLLEPVVEALEQSEVPQLLALTRFRLARAVAAGEPHSQVPHDLARQALAHYRSTNEGPMAEAISSWIARREPTASDEGKQP